MLEKRVTKKTHPNFQLSKFYRPESTDIKGFSKKCNY